MLNRNLTDIKSELRRLYKVDVLASDHDNDDALMQDRCYYTAALTVAIVAVTIFASPHPPRASPPLSEKVLAEIDKRRVKCYYVIAAGTGASVRPFPVPLAHRRPHNQTLSPCTRPDRVTRKPSPDRNNRRNFFAVPPLKNRRTADSSTHRSLHLFTVHRTLCRRNVDRDGRR